MCFLTPHVCQGNPYFSSSIDPSTTQAAHALSGRISTGSCGAVQRMKPGVTSVAGLSLWAEDWDVGSGWYYMHIYIYPSIYLYLCMHMYVYIYIYPEVVEYGHDKKQATKKGASLTKKWWFILDCSSASLLTQPISKYIIEIAWYNFLRLFLASGLFPLVCPAQFLLNFRLYP